MLRMRMSVVTRVTASNCCSSWTRPPCKVWRYLASAQPRGAIVNARYWRSIRTSISPSTLGTSNSRSPRRPVSVENSIEYRPGGIV